MADRGHSNRLNCSETGQEICRRTGIGLGISDSVYFYAPNNGAPIFFAAAFAATGLFHLWQCFHYKYFQVMAALSFFCCVLTAAFGARAYGARHADDAQVYTASTMLLYIAPPLLELTNYLILRRIFHFVPYFAPMHPVRMLVTFATLTVVIELLSIAGIAYLANQDLPDKSIQMGDTLTKASLVLQLLIIALFFPLAGTLHRCCRAAKINSPRVTRPLLLLYTSMLLALARTVYRTVQHFAVPASTKGLDPLTLDPIVRFEWFFYVFDAAPMLVGAVLWNLGHPRRWLPENPQMYLAQDGVTVLRGPGWKDSRSLGETFFNPFAMLTTRGGHQKQFWEQNGYVLGTRRARPTRGV
ncbi:hypothetical protein C8A00DRAFT_43882 [Chaetomidium leptoderma]|uniref:RTA1 domain protein n=1 Tax=Chaetomidium leptoderma TaxID=669021 RepID=A0AAN6VKC3_9PEZI|nr:hypothetical protein C8A00DRAFT_43882 [Chaetomidium leptoderma]